MKQPSPPPSPVRPVGADPIAGARILLIAPGATDAPALASGLRDVGAAVSVVGSLAKGDEAVRAGGQNVVLLDLPGREEESLSLLHAWRQDGLWGYVLLLAAEDDRSTGVRGLNAGADTFLARPVTVGSLLTHLRALLRSVRARDARVVRVHDLEIDTSTRKVTRAGQSIRLTAREYGLLEFLATRRGKVVSRALLWQQLCGGRVAPRSNMVDVYIRQLRSKIDDGFDLPLIHTSRGWGYLVRGDEAPG